MADDLTGAKRETAILATCIVQTLNESDPSFQERFLGRLQRAYTRLGATRKWARSMKVGGDRQCRCRNPDKSIALPTHARPHRPPRPLPSCPRHPTR
jgi:hypothetical protein